MKIRSDFVTNSSSSSFIICFARIADNNKANDILKKYPDIEVYTGEEVMQRIKNSRWGNWLEYDWAGIDVTPDKDYIETNIDNSFIVYSDMFDLYEDDDGEIDYDVDYDDFDTTVFDCITEKNGFSDVELQYGAGRNG